jgi:hypothetical protein
MGLFSRFLMAHGRAPEIEESAQEPDWNAEVPFNRRAKAISPNEPNFPYIFQMLVGGPKRRKLTAASSSSTKTGQSRRSFAASGTGKRGGVRTVHYFGGDDVPVFMLAVIRKGDRDNLSKAECNALKKELQGIADAYKASAKSRAAKRRVKY